LNQNYSCIRRRRRKRYMNWHRL